MHLADGILVEPAVLVAANAIGATLALATARDAMRSERQGAAFTGTLAAFVLAAQALNVPLLPGASAHVIGAGLLTILIGPGRAVLALAAVLLVQALLFADGGITVLGINALNIAVLPVLTVHALRRLLGEKRLMLAAGLGTLLGTVLGSAALGAVLVFGAGISAPVAFGWLVGMQTLAGVIEGGLTMIAVRHLAARLPGALGRSGDPAVPTRLDRSSRAALPERRRALAWAAIAVGVAIVLLPLASNAPDALAKVLEQARPSP